MRPRLHSALGPSVVSIFLSAGCYSVSPPQINEGVYSVRYGQRFGYVAVGIMPYSSFFGEIRGVEPGMGVTIYVPPLLPIQTVALVGMVIAPLAVVAAVADGEGDVGAVLEGLDDLQAFLTIDPRSGVSDALRNVTRNVISDFSLDLGFTYSEHDDADYGGELTYSGLVFGLRLAGPRECRPRIYACGGLGWYWFDYDNRPDASVPGPYAGVGMEFLNPAGGLSLGLELRANFYFGKDDAGEVVDGGATQAIVQAAYYW